MAEITDATVEKYIYDILPARDEALAEMELEAKKRSIPIVGPAVGRILYQYAVMIGAHRVFELGSAIGYSTLWLARAAGKEGTVYYTDGSVKNAAEAKGYFERAGVADRIIIMAGDAIESLEKVDGEFDLIFNDIDKHGYPDAFRKAIPRLRKGGLFITDNVLWSGRIAEKKDQDRDTKAIREFNTLIYSTPGIYSVILPIRDGIAVCRKE